MVPEISHRCPACGVSLRDFGEGVLFCPECGSALAGSQKNVGSDDGTRLSETLNATVSVQSAQAMTAESDRPSTSTAEQTVTPAPEERISARERTRETLQRASQMTRGAIEDNVKRVEKIHHVSSVVLEEAHYDPSLRFVLVALGLFLVFVILLVLSKVMG